MIVLSVGINPACSLIFWIEISNLHVYWFSRKFSPCTSVLSCTFNVILEFSHLHVYLVLHFYSVLTLEYLLSLGLISNLFDCSNHYIKTRILWYWSHWLKTTLILHLQTSLLNTSLMTSKILRLIVWVKYLDGGIHV